MLASTIQKSLILKILCLLFLTSCGITPCPFEPTIDLCTTLRTVDKLPSAFPASTEGDKEWERELYLGIQFAKEFDLYRAITCYKRALFLAPQEKKIEIEYRIIEAYYLGQKTQDVIEIYETGNLREVQVSFPSIKELLLILYDSYEKEGYPEKACRIKRLLESLDKPLSEKVELYEAVVEADFCFLNELREEDVDVDAFLRCYEENTKSIRKAQVLNALLPGAGYYYVEQKKTALTAFIINALFTYGAYQFFHRGYTAAGIITTSLEMGWYIGGINGAGLAAAEWNERGYEIRGKEFLLRKKLFPVLMFEYAF